MEHEPITVFSRTGYFQVDPVGRRAIEKLVNETERMVWASWTNRPDGKGNMIWLVSLQSCYPFPARRESLTLDREQVSFEYYVTECAVHGEVVVFERITMNKYGCMEATQTVMNKNGQTVECQDREPSRGSRGHDFLKSAQNAVCGFNGQPWNYDLQPLWDAFETIMRQQHYRIRKGT
jgi:hypothetical protein